MSNTKSQTYKDDVAKYVKKIDNNLFDALYKIYAGVVARKDARLVAAKDPEEVKRVKRNFIKGKLGITGEKADKAFDNVMKTLAGTRQKNRLTVYYLLTIELKGKKKFID